MKIDLSVFIQSDIMQKKKKGFFFSFCHSMPPEFWVEFHTIIVLMNSRPFITRTVLMIKKQGV